MKSLYVAGTHEAAALVLNVASIMPDLPVLWYVVSAVYLHAF
jgi:hypothetical protein